MPLSRAVGFKTLMVVRVWWVAASLVVACGSQDRDLPPPATRPVQAAASDEVEPGTCVEEPASWERVDALLSRSCRSCHSETLTGDARLGAPAGVDFDREPALRRHAERILARAVVEGTMPPGGALPDCSRAMLDEYLQGVLAGECTPDCEGRACGDDGCGGACGDCSEDQICNLLGACLDAICTPNCDHRSCGDDGCGGDCGDCGAGTSCSDAGSCECAPDCDDRTCGSDGCGGSCGDCAGNELCSLVGACICVPDCQDHECGSDGCGGSCGHCSGPDECDGDQKCSCTPDCDGRACGDDGCGNSCGTCDDPLVCNSNEGQCQTTCTPDCTDKICGDNGCNDSCGECDSGLSCAAGVSCECVPDCAGKQCGEDGCGHECGSCDDGLDCTSEGHCECIPDCSGRECGEDGCGHECGSCDDGSYCDAGGQCVCEPSCAPGSCGDDGCGASCACEQGQTCDAELCSWPEVSFVGDVYPLFVDTCNTSGCHSTTSGSPKAMLDLLGSATAHGELVGIASVNCTVTPKTLVVANDVAASYLINKLTGVGMCGGQPMPRSAPMSGLPNPPALSDAQIDLVRAWIATGALDD